MLFFMDNFRVCVKGDESEKGIDCLFDVCLSFLLTYTRHEREPFTSISVYHRE